MRSFTFALAIAAVLGGPAIVAPSPVQASEIKYVVNGVPITSYDIQRRAAFIKLQRSKGSASDQMIEQALREAEVKRLGIRISDQQVDDAYARFAKNNKMPLAQLDAIMNQSGVSKQHFKAFIRSQMGWNQALSARARSKSGGKSEQDVVAQMLKNGGNKPRATEYMLQQVIFVVPAAERGATLGKRKREAEAMRQRFTGCDSTRQFAKGLIDVTVRDLGRVLEPQLPTEWADPIKKAKNGSATPVRETERGVEFIGVCSTREVSDDKVAQLMFQAQDAGSDKAADELSTKYIKELRDKAKIVQR